jgi:hypothetical protein
MTDQPAASRPPATGRLGPLPLGLSVYALTSLIVVLGVLFGQAVVALAPHPFAKRGDLIESFANWDGRWYINIVEHGYLYNPATPSSVAFFPLYPLLGRGVVELTGLRTDLALLLVSHLCLATAFVLLAVYLRERFSNAREPLAEFTLLALALFPTTVFFRMAYTESLFLCLLVLFLYALERRWPLAVIALIVGTATASRATGVGLLPPFALHVWQRSSSARQGAGRLLWLVPLACWGIAGWMLYQQVVFGDALVFAKTQANWRVRPVVEAAPLADKWASLLSFEPIWSVFDPSSSAYWATPEPPSLPPLFSLQFANPLYFAFAVGVTTLGWTRGWLRSSEVVLVAALLLIPYVASSYEMHMAGAARFAAVVLPVYVVLGRILCRMALPLSICLLAVSGSLLLIYGALFARWYRFF